MPSNRDRKQIDVRTTTRNRVIVIGVLPEQLRPPVEPVTNYPRAETHQQTKPTHLAYHPKNKKREYIPSHPPKEVLFHCNPVAFRKKPTVP